MQKLTTTTVITDMETGEEIGHIVSENIVDDDGVIGACDGDCENCEDNTLCEDTIEYSPELVGEVSFDLYDVVSKAIALVALGFSAATAIKLWKKVR